MIKFLLTWFCLFAGFFVLAGITFMAVHFLGELGFSILLIAVLTAFMAWVFTT